MEKPRRTVETTDRELTTQMALRTGCGRLSEDSMHLWEFRAHRALIALLHQLEIHHGYSPGAW